MKFFQSKQAAYLSDAVCALLLCVSLSLAVFPLAGLSIGLGRCVLIAGLAIALVFALTRRWWVLPALLILSAAVLLLVTGILGIHGAVIPFIRGLLDWCAAGFPENKLYSHNLIRFAVELIAALPAAAVSLLFVRKLFFFPIVPIGSAALLFWFYFNLRINFFPALSLLLLFNFVSMSKKTAARVNRDRPETEKIGAALLPLTALLLAGLIILCTTAFVPEKDGEWRSKLLVNTVQDIRDYFNGGSGDAPVDGSFSLSRSGFSPLGSRLGGSVIADHTIVMKISTDTPVCLTGAIFNTYDGASWTKAGSMRRFRFNSLLWRDKRNETFLLDLPAGGADEKALYDQLTTTAEYDISYSQSGRSVFYAGQISALTSRKIDTSDLFFNNQPELFVTDSRTFMNYQFSTTVFDRALPDFDQNFLALEALEQRNEDPRFDAVKAEYLGLPDSLPDSVYKTADDITAGCETPYQKAAAIERWLNQHCEYTLTPGDPPEDVDFVANFLTDRKGYCVYFASAMTVLARCEGLPARYVTGFAMMRNPKLQMDGFYVATNATAHAWTEIYFEGIGWVPFDATGWDFSQPAEVTETDVDASGFVIPVGSTGDTASGDGSGDTEKKPGLPSGLRGVLIVLAFLAAAAAILAFIRFIVLFFGAQSYYQRLKRQYPYPCDRADACYHRLVKQTEFLGVPQKDGDTIALYAKRVDDVLGGDAMTRASEYVIRMRFALQTPTEAGISEMCDFSATLEKQLRARLGLTGYIWRRLILGR